MARCKTGEGKNGKQEVGSLPLPKSARKLAELQLERWIDSVLASVDFEENIHYIVDENQIKPVDYDSTGVIQSATFYTNGLHQILQVKHGLRVTSETLTTNFLSNIAIFKKYGENLVGFTGTLGSTYCKKLLEDVYNVETMIVPDLYHKQYRELPPQILHSREDWINKIVYSSLHEISKNRGCLTVCKSIKDAEEIAEAIKNAQPQTKLLMSLKPVVQTYTRNDRNQEKRVERIGRREIIVATNLAGRGTDVNTEKIDDCGGLHLVKTFEPSSTRGLEQLEGRVARLGKQGTGELIVFSDNPTVNYDDLKQMRDEQENKRLCSFKNKELIDIQLRDELFLRFCKLYSEIREALKKEHFFRRLTPIDRIYLSAVEHEWAFFLKSIENLTDKTEIEGLYLAFEKKIQENKYDIDKTISMTNNCTFWTFIGNEYYRQGNFFKDNTQLALNSFEKGISLDSQIAAEAHAGKAYSLLRGKYRIYWKNSHRFPNYKDLAEHHLKESLNILDSEMKLYAVAHALRHRSQSFPGTELAKQLEEKITLIGEYSSNLRSILTAIEKSRRTVYTTHSWTSCGTNHEYSRTRKLDEKNLTIVGIHGDGLYDLEFHDLTSRYDMGERDQAINVLQKADQIAVKIINQDPATVIKCFGNHSSLYLEVELIDVGSINEVGSIVSKMCPPKGLYIIKLHNLTQELLAKLMTLKSEIGFEKVILEYEEKENDTDACVWREVKESGWDEINFKVTVELHLQYIDGNHLTELEKILPLETNISLILANVANYICSDDIDDECVHFLQSFPKSTFYAKNLSTKTSTDVVKRLRENQLPFILILQKLELVRANKILKNSGRKVERMEEKKFNEMGFQYSSTFIPVATLQELQQRGMVLMPQFAEANFIPWRSIGTIVLISAAQLALALAVSGMAPNVGMALFTEGLADLSVAGYVAITREFSWKNYRRQKAFSVAISITSMGISKLFQGAKAGTNLAKGIATEVIEQSVTMSANATSKAAIEAAQASFTSTAAIIASIGEITTQFGLRKAAQCGISIAIDSLRPYIFRKIEHYVSTRLENQKFPHTLATAAVFYDTNLLVDKIEVFVHEVISQKSGTSEWLSAVAPLRSSLIQALTDSVLAQSLFAIGAVAETLFGQCTHLKAVLRDVCIHVQSELESECGLFTIEYAIKERFQINPEEANEIASLIESTNNSIFQVTKFPDDTDLRLAKYEGINLDSLRSLQSDVEEERRSLLNTKECLSRVIAIVAERLTDYVVLVSNNHLAQPLLHTTFSGLVFTVGKSIRNKHNIPIKQRSLDAKLEQIDKNTWEEEKMQKKRLLRNKCRLSTLPNTANSLQNDLVQLDRISFRYMSNQQTNGITSVLKIYPGGILEGLILSLVNNLHTEFISNPKYKITEEDVVNQRVIIHYPIGHVTDVSSRSFTLIKLDGEHIQTNSFNCIYELYETITGVAENKLRAQVISFISSHEDSFKQITESVNWVKTTLPDTTNNYLNLASLRTGMETMRQRREENNLVQMFSRLVNYVTAVVGAEGING